MAILSKAERTYIDNKMEEFRVLSEYKAFLIKVKGMYQITNRSNAIAYIRSNADLIFDMATEDVINNKTR